MAEIELLSVRDAADRLGTSEQAVRLMASSGRVEAVKYGGVWLLDPRSVERLRRARPRQGRPLSSRMAWLVLLLASGQQPPEELTRRDHHLSRARRWLGSRSLVDDAPQLRDRASSTRYFVHPSELARLQERGDVMATGMSAAGTIGLHGGDDAIELYAPLRLRRALIDEHALTEGDGPVLIRWVDNEIWPAIAADVAPRAAILVDLVDHDDPRARREAAQALSHA